MSAVVIRYHYYKYQNSLYQHNDGIKEGPMQSTLVQSGQTPAAIYSPRPPLSTGVPGVASALLQGRQNGVVVMMWCRFFVLSYNNRRIVLVHIKVLVKYIVEREAYSDLALPLYAAAHTAIGARYVSRRCRCTLLYFYRRCIVVVYIKLNLASIF